MDRQLRNHHSDPIRQDPRPTIGRQRQESLALRRMTRPRPVFTITAPLGFVRRQAGAGSVLMRQPDGLHCVGSCTCRGIEVSIVWNEDDAGQRASSLHDAGRLVFSPGADAGSLIARSL